MWARGCKVLSKQNIVPTIFECCVCVLYGIHFESLFLFCILIFDGGMMSGAILFSQAFFVRFLFFWHDKQAKLHFLLHIFTSSRRAQNSPIRQEHNRARCPQLLSSAEVDGVLQRILIRSGRCLRKHSFPQRSCGVGAGDQGVPRSWHSTQRPRQPRYEGSTSPLRGEATISNTPGEPHPFHLLGRGKETSISRA